MSGPDLHDPEIHAAYSELAAHYGTAVIPARPARPRDKAKVEVGVQIAQRWILARLRNRTFFSLEELNEAISELLEDLNGRAFAKLDGCRRSLFEEVDRPALKPLPERRFVPAEWAYARVNIDYHVEYDHRLYSVPHTLTGRSVELRVTASTVEILHDRLRVASHMRSYGPRGSAVTTSEHRPKSHRDYGDWPPSRMIDWAASYGPNVAKVFEAILASRPHPEQGYRSCMALVRTAKSVETILKRGLDRLALDTSVPNPIGTHENIRGAEYFDTSTSKGSTRSVH